MAPCVPSGGDRHGSRAPQDLQLDGCALDTRDAQRHAAVVDLVVAELLLEGHTRQGLLAPRPPHREGLRVNALMVTSFSTIFNSTWKKQSVDLVFLQCLPLT